jgi:hypothetical protein
MANYVAHYRKKLETLRRQRLNLLRLLERNPAPGELAQAADAVKDSQVRALQAKRAQIRPCDSNAKRLRNIDVEIARCEKLSVDEIIDLCRRCRSKSSHNQT